MNTQPKFNIYLTQEDLRKLLRFLIYLEVFFVFMYLLAFIIAPDFPWGPINNFFDFDEDDWSIPSWFASIQYLFIGIPTFISAMQSSVGKLKSKKILYSIVAVSMFLALDEAVGIHEQITVAAEKLDIQLLQSLSFGGHGAWISVYALLGMILILFVYRDLPSLWAAYKKEGTYILAGGVLLGMGEVGFEIVGYLFLRTTTSGLLYDLEVAIEEFFALAGVSLILYGVLLLLMKIQNDDKNEG